MPPRAPSGSTQGGEHDINQMTKSRVNNKETSRLRKEMYYKYQVTAGEILYTIKGNLLHFISLSWASFQGHSQLVIYLNIIRDFTPSVEESVLKQFMWLCLCAVYILWLMVCFFIHGGDSQMWPEDNCCKMSRATMNQSCSRKRFSHRKLP